VRSVKVGNDTCPHCQRVFRASSSTRSPEK
jgi:hypothetical protein